jgi:hypothetical protein
MNLETLLTRLRRDYLDDTTTPGQLWSDAALIDHLNAAVTQVCLRARCLVDTETPEVTQYALAEGDRYITLHPAILAVRHARIVGHCHGLAGITAKRLWKEKPDWENSEAGSPDYWIPDYHDGRLYLDRPVDSAGVLHLNVWRTPLESEVMAADGDVPAIPSHWRENLLDWAAHLAFSLIDADTRSDQRAVDYAQRFAAKVGRLPSMTEIRLWGISPIVGVQAEFV